MTDEERYEIEKGHQAIDEFVRDMKSKMDKSTLQKGRRGWDNPDAISKEGLIKMLEEHVSKGDPVDVALFAMMIWYRNTFLNGS